MGSKQSIGSVIRRRWLVRLKTNFPTTKYFLATSKRLKIVGSSTRKRNKKPGGCGLRDQAS